MIEKKPANNRRIPLRTTPKPYMTLSRLSAYAWLLSFIVLSGCMFVIGVVIGRNTAPVFDMDVINANMERLKDSSLKAAQKQKETLLEMAKGIDIINPLKEKSMIAYKPYIPPLKTAKYDKNEKPADAPGSGEPPVAADQNQAAPESQQIQLAQAPPAEPPVLENSPPDAGAAQTPTEPMPPEKPVAVKEAAPKPKLIKEPVHAPEAPVLAALETKNSQTAEPPGQVAQNTELSRPGPAEGVAETADPVEHSGGSHDHPALLSEDPASENMPQETPPAEVSAKPGAKQYTIQVTSLRDMDKANLVRDKFRQKGYPAYCQSIPVRGEVWHRVRIGPYPDRAIAEKDRQRLEEAGFDALMFTVDN